MVEYKNMHLYFLNTIQRVWDQYTPRYWVVQKQSRLNVIRIAYILLLTYKTFFHGDLPYRNTWINSMIYTSIMNTENNLIQPIIFWCFLPKSSYSDVSLIICKQP